MAESENVRLVHQTIGMFNEGRIEEALDTVDDDFEMDWSNSIGPLKGVYTGRSQLRTFWTTFRDAWEEVRYEVEEVIEVDDSQLIAVNQLRMRGRGSGVDVEATGAQLWKVAGGRPRSVKLYQSKAEALEAVAGRS